MSAQVLVVEDDASLRLALCDNLEDEGYVVTSATSLSTARAACARQAFDVVVLDLMLSDGDGTALCRELRKSQSPARILMLTARTLEDDLVKGFDAGADDYLGKPYRLRELLARIAALARRGAAPSSSAHRLGPFEIDETRRTVTGPDGAVELTKKEFDVLLCLLRAGDAVVTRDALLDQVWGHVVVDTHTVDNFVSSLKKKLKTNAPPAFELKTVRGVGFRLVR